MTATDPATLRPRHWLLLAALFLAWQLPGVLGREPWKSDEAYTMGLVHHMLRTGDLLVPHLGGEPFLQKPPLYFMIAAGTAKLLSPWCAPHVGARMASLLFNALTMAFAGLASRELNGRGRGWPAALLFLACLGPVHMAHFILTDLALLTGMTLALYGMALGLRRPWAGGLACGTGAGLAFMAKGLLGAGLPAVAVLLLPVFDRRWRGANGWRFAGGCILAALPWVTIWPLLLFLRSPQLFSDWLIDNNFARFNPGLARWLKQGLETVARATGRLGEGESLAFHDVNGPKGTRGYMLVLLPWYAFPASALAAWTLWREGRAGWADPRLRVPVIALLTGLAVFTASKDGREIYALPLVAPLLVLGARRLEDLPASVARRLDAAVSAVFSVAAALLWAAWAGLLGGLDAWIWPRFRREIPGYVAAFDAPTFFAALLLTAAWVILQLRRRSGPLFLPAHGAAGVALVYGLAMTLFLPAAEWRMSYRRQFEPLRALLPAPGATVLSRGLGEPQRAMLDYYADLRTVRLVRRKDDPGRGEWFLTQTTYPADTHHPGAGWTRVWQDVHESEWFQLFRRTRE